MQKRFRRLAMFMGAAALVSGGVVMLACGTDNGTVATPPIEGGPKVDGGGGGDTSMTDPDTGTDPDAGGADADCSKNPILRDYTNGFRCAFVAPNDAGPDGGTNSNCTNLEECCNTGDKIGAAFQPSFCATGKNGTESLCKAQALAHNSSFDAGQTWECADKNACAGGGAAGPICCLVQDLDRLALDPVKNKLNIGNTPSTDKNHPPACKVQRSYNDDGSRCRTACAGTEFRLCSLTDACPAGNTCTPFVDFQNTHRGYCKPN